MQKYYLLCRYFYGAASRRGAPPMPLQGVWTADNGGLPPWKGDYHNDLNTQMTYIAYQAAGHFDEGACYLDFLGQADAGLHGVRPRLLRHAGPGLAGRDVAGRAAARRLGHVQPVADHDLVERAPVLPALALHDGRRVPARTGLPVVPGGGRMPAGPAQAGRAGHPQAAALLLAGDLRQQRPRLADSEQQLRPVLPEDAVPGADRNGRRAGPSRRSPAMARDRRRARRLPRRRHRDVAPGRPDAAARQPPAPVEHHRPVPVQPDHLRRRRARPAAHPAPRSPSGTSSARAPGAATASPG